MISTENSFSIATNFGMCFVVVSLFYRSFISLNSSSNRVVVFLFFSSNRMFAIVSPSASPLQVAALCHFFRISILASFSYNSRTHCLPVDSRRHFTSLFRIVTVVTLSVFRFFFHDVVHSSNIEKSDPVTISFRSFSLLSSLIFVNYSIEPFNAIDA